MFTLKVDEGHFCYCIFGFYDKCEYSNQTVNMLCKTILIFPFLTYSFFLQNCLNFEKEKKI